MEHINPILLNRFTGFFKAEIVSINPNKEELEEILEEEIDYEPSYEFQSSLTNKGRRFDFYFQNIGGGQLFKHSIYLSQEDDEFKSGSKRWINNHGEFQITNSEEQLFDSMKWVQSWNKEQNRYVNTEEEKEVRVAVKGEYELMSLYNLGKSGFIDVDYSIKYGKVDIPKGIPYCAGFAYVENDENYTQKLFKEFIPLNNYQDFVYNKPNQYNRKRFNKWHDNFNYIKDSVIYNFGILQPIKEEFIPKTKQFDQFNSDY